MTLCRSLTPSGEERLRNGQRDPAPGTDLGKRV
jgi:hypothetical protein